MPFGNVTTKIELRQAILALETALSLTGMNDTNHGKRVAYIATQIASALGLSDSRIQFIFDLGMLHDCGVSTEKMHVKLVNLFDGPHTAHHCKVGYQLLNNFLPLARCAKPILYHHTHWDELANMDIDSDVALAANIIFLADRVDVLSIGHSKEKLLLYREEIINRIQSHRGKMFNPELVDAFQKIANSEAFWLSLEDRHVLRFVFDMGKREFSAPLNFKELKQLALIFSHIVDQKSSFTAQHSIGVGRLAGYLAELASLPVSTCEKIEIAGYLHDIGKLHVPDKILDKPGPLADLERSVMDQHSYETYEILRHIKGLEDISLWAAYHHESIDGTGYPFHPSQKNLPIEARIIAVADVFQALIQDRPYRAGMDLGQTLSILHDMEKSEKLDSEILSLVYENTEQCLESANSQYSLAVEQAFS